MGSRLTRPLRFTPRRDAGVYGLERALAHGGFAPVAGVDEAGRGACAGPLVVGAAMLPAGRRGQIEGLTDSKLLTPKRREEIYAEIMKRALAWSVVIIECGDIDRNGLHRCNIAGMRRALAALDVRPAYVLSDGFRVPGVDVPSLAVPKGDRVAACVAAASVVAKVTRDRIMVKLHESHPKYGFDVHKGYITPEHSSALEIHGPCSEHRYSFVNVARVGGLLSGAAQGDEDAGEPVDLSAAVEAREEALDALVDPDEAEAAQDVRGTGVRENGNGRPGASEGPADPVSQEGAWT